MKDIIFGRDTLSLHIADNKEMAIYWIKHIDKWHKKDPYAQKERKQLIKDWNLER